METTVMESGKIYRLDRTIEKRKKIQVTGFTPAGSLYSADRVNLNKSLIRNSQTYIFRTKGDSMIDLGILPGALIVFEQRLGYFSGEICVVRIGTEFYVRKLLVENGRRYLCPANEVNRNYKRVEVTEFLDFEICGAVTDAINSLRRVKAKSAEPPKINCSSIKKLIA